MQQLIQNDLLVPRVRRTARDVKQMRLPNFYVCPADRARSEPVRWRTFDCEVSYKKEKASCDAEVVEYKGETPDDLEGRRNGKGSCIEFKTHQIMVLTEWSASWNEIQLQAAFDPEAMFGHDQSNVMQEVELGYRPAEKELVNSRVDKYYYPLLRVPVFYRGGSLPPAGVATRAFLGKEVDRMPDVTGRYWYVYGGMQVPLLNASLPRQTLIENGRVTVVPRESVSGMVHIVLTIEDFETYGYQELSFGVPLMKALGQIAGVGAMLMWVATRCKVPKTGMVGHIQELGSRRDIAFSELDTDRDYHQGDTGDQSDVEGSTLLAGAQE